MRKYVTVHNNSIPLLSPLRLQIAADFLTRLRGLMFTDMIAQNEGLLLIESQDSRLGASIHMLFMNYDIGVVWANQEGVVMDSTLAHRWQPAYMPKSPSSLILEIHPSRLPEFKPGDKLELIDV